MKVRFFRNTHQAPDFEKYRPELLAQIAEGTLAVHMLSHIEGKTFDEVLHEVLDYEEQFPDAKQAEPVLATLREIVEGLENTSVRCEIEENPAIPHDHWKTGASCRACILEGFQAIGSGDNVQDVVSAGEHLRGGV